MTTEINVTENAGNNGLTEQVLADSEEDREPTAKQLAEEEEELKKIGLNRETVHTSTIDWFLNSARLARSISTDEHDRRVLHDVRFVLLIANRYVNRGLDLEDLLQEGLIGMMKAWEKFEPERGFTFLTYAAWWIRQRMTRAIDNQANTIRIPVHVQALRRKISWISQQLENELGRRPTLEEIASRTGLSIESIGKAFSLSGTIATSVDKSCSIDDGDSSRKMLEVIPDERAHSPADILIAKEESTIATLLAELDGIFGVSTRDRDIFRSYFRLDDGVVPQTLDSVGNKFGMSRERVRQIRNKILKKMNGAPKGLPPGFKMRKAKPHRFHVRASPAFVNWSPKPGMDRTEALQSLICRAFELTPADLKGNSKRDDVVWTRTLMAGMMMDELGQQTETVELFFSGCSDAKDVPRVIERVLSEDPLMRKDTERIREHFRKIMELQ